MNTSYRHFFLFVHEVGGLGTIVERGAKRLGQFDLVDKRELAPLDELNEAILAEEKSR